MVIQSSTAEAVHVFRPDRADRGERPLVLGFAYSLTPDGAPGLYNHILAQSIINDWAGRAAWIGVQWEIKDAMDDPRLGTEWYSQLRSAQPTTNILLRRLGSLRTRPGQTKVHTVAPFDPIQAKITGGHDGLDWRAFRELLLDSMRPAGDPAVSKLAEAIVNLARKSVFGNSSQEILCKSISDAQQLAIYLNQLIRANSDLHRQMYVEGVQMLELSGRQREHFGPVGFERRELPPPDARIGTYQAHRVNRLSIDAICRDRDILPEPVYLSTKGVLERLFQQMDGRPNFDRIFIYASPVHSGRCERQFLEFAESKGWSVPLSHVTKMYSATDMAPCGWIWESRTAQVWCRSKAAWDAYEQNNARLA